MISRRWRIYQCNPNLIVFYLASQTQNQDSLGLKSHKSHVHRLNQQRQIAQVRCIGHSSTKAGDSTAVHVSRLNASAVPGDP